MKEGWTMNEGRKEDGGADRLLLAKPIQSRNTRSRNK
jgi:hypothetical protein